MPIGFLRMERMAHVDHRGRRPRVTIGSRSALPLGDRPGEGEDQPELAEDVPSGVLGLQRLRSAAHRIWLAERTVR